MGLGERFTLRELITAVENYYGCKVEIIPLPNMPLPYTATAFVVPGVYIGIFYRDDVPEDHAHQLICHELVHVFCSHRGYGYQKVATDLIDQLVAYIPDAYQTAACRICNRAHFDEPQEVEAECGGAYLASKLISADDAFMTFLLDV